MDRLVVTSLDKLPNVDNKLSKFVKDPSSLWSVLRDTGGAISGEFARMFLFGRESPNELDIVVSDPQLIEGEKQKLFEEYLGDSEGYTLFVNEGTLSPRTTQVLRCTRNDGIVINVHCHIPGEADDVRHAVLDAAYSTHIACVIGFGEAYCVFPPALREKDIWVLSLSLTTAQRSKL
ncbi:hypothetical protein N7471_010388 [Penicillium samsonianum]|uniref:uncharacterized protein n=1 Tax=Penicillium samsonianum TaxID=1882272 RepID=UPI002548A2AE|nr:uncharacterized protein N7471_010365 [Penicillium samsonianum]XP_057132086.1 uncharacterized protein N7471_010388 [Penicillium samsonianum]KAJ6125872.1 hypothetical protein N7471_010365 [Penicillium samsonianum]KAJ6125895.1 hypothetical protein N7471_010388 [Penicillium samsonianum]